MQRTAIPSLVLLLVTMSSSVSAQSHFKNCEAVTGSNATVIIPPSAAITLYGEALAENSEIAVYTQEGVCAGVVVLNGDAASFPVWGDNSVTDTRDGFAEMEGLTYRVWDASTDIEYDGASLSTDVHFSDARSFFRTENSFVEDAVYVLESLSIDISLLSADHMGETGSVSVSQSSRDEWHLVHLLSSYSGPVVTMGPLSFTGPHPSTVRVRNVTSTSFEFKIDEWDYLDGSHVEETVGYLVVEAGKHTLADGRVVQAGYARAGMDKRVVSFPEPFDSQPVVLSQITTVADSRAAVTRQSEVSVKGFSVFLQPQESVTAHDDEDVAWIAASAGSGSTGGRSYEVGLTGNAVSDEWSSLTLRQDYSSTPVLLATMQTANGSNTAGMRMKNHSASSVDVSVEEEQSLDEEMQHVDETVGYMAFEAGPVEAGSTTLGTLAKKEASGDAADQQKRSFAAAFDIPDEFALRGNYPNPFNPQTTIRYDLPAAVHLRLEVFDVVGRRVALLADGVQEAGTHDVHFNAAEQPSGLYLYRLTAGSFVQTGSMILMK